MTRALLLGLDLGGGSVRCLAVDATRGEHWTAARPLAPRAVAALGGLGFSFALDGEASLDATLAAVTRACLERASATAAEVIGIACTSQRHTTIVVDREGDLLLAAPNRDSRAVGEAMRLAAEHGDAVNAATGHWPHPIFMAPRLQWLRDRDPENFRRAQHAFSASDWLGWRLTGEAAADPTQAGETGLLDLVSRNWSSDWCERLGVPRTLLPPIAEPGQKLGELTREAADWLGLAAGTPVAVGVADTQASAIGCDALRCGDTLIVAGTTLPIYRATANAPCDPAARCWVGQHPLASARIVESNQGPVGEPLAWFARLLHPDAASPVGAFFAEARSAEPGAHAALSTLGAEVMNAREARLPYAKLSFSHMALPGGDTHESSQPGGGAKARAALSRAVAEGIACGIRANLEQVAEFAAAGERGPVLTGGLAQSPTFAGIVAAMLGGEVRVSRTHETSALGAAACAGVAAGCFADLETAARALVEEPQLYRSSDAETEAMSASYAAWQTERAAHHATDRAGSARSTGPMLKLAAARARSVPGATSGSRIRILATAGLDPTSVARLRELGDVEYASFRDAKRFLTGPSLVAALEAFDVFLTEIDVVDAESIAASKSLRAVISCRGDAVNVDIPACTLHGIPVLNTPGRNADAVADLTIAFMLMLARKLADATSFLRSGDIEAGDLGKMGQAFNAFRGRELGGQTIGLVGLGAVGRGVARRLGGFGARVLVADPFADAESAWAAGAELVTLEELLAQSDITSLHAPVNDATRGMIDTHALAGMKAGSALINTARAALVDEAALAAALVSGHLSGAALDVFSVEPPGSDSALLAAPNLIATPHVAGNSFEISAHQGRIAADELAALLGGSSPRFCLNPQVLADFDWSAPRRQPTPAELEAAKGGPAPSVSDLLRDAKGSPKKSGPAS